MSANAKPTARREHVLARVRWAGALLAAAALAALVATASPGPARAASGTGYDQITGIGQTDSGVTVPWTQGILDASNQPIASASASRSPSSFMYDDFKSLQVKVSQTKNLGHQGITVSWSGGTPTDFSGSLHGNFLQIMECYGDATTGPTPEQCQYGSSRMLGGGGGIAPQSIGTRDGLLCVAGAVADPGNPPQGLDGSNGLAGCDPAEPANPTDIAPCPGDACDNTHTAFSIPFIPVTAQTSADYAYGPVTTYYAAANSNEVQFAATRGDGTGQRQFETLTNTQSPGLGCGAKDPSQNNKARGCWLVIVPRGVHEPNGYKVTTGSLTTGPQFQLVTSPLSAGNWAQRIQIHLDYSPLESFCPSSTLERQTQGTQLILRAMQSWEVALNQQGNCKRIYGFSVPPAEASVTQDLADPTGSGVGLGFTTIPIGSEAARQGQPVAKLPSIVYAPVGVIGADFGFNISQAPPPDNQVDNVTTPVKLTPMLLAKSLTQSYRADLPDYYPENSLPGPSWSTSNPVDISHDVTFHNLNPGIAPFSVAAISLAPLDTEDHSAVNQQIWQWIQADSATGSWLGGTPDKADGNMVIDPAYKALNLGKPPAIDSYPRAYTGVLDSPNPSIPTQIQRRDSIDILPFVGTNNEAAADLVVGNNPSLSGSWDPVAVNPDGSMGAFTKYGIEPPGQLFMWAASDTPDLAAYGLLPATLCNDAGTTCVAPSVASVSAALKSAVADKKTGVLQVNPARVGAGAWPLTQVIYAAVPTNQDATALTDYADLIAFAAGTGQAAGTASGDLPPGYLPLPDNLKAQAQAAVAKLRAIANPQPTHSPTQSQSATTSASSTNTGTGTGTGTGASGGNTTPAPIASPGAAATASTSQGPGATPGSSPTGPQVVPPTVQLVVGTTPKQPVGKIHWALITVLIVGLVGAGGGLVLRSGGLPRWRVPRLPSWPGRRRARDELI